MTDKEFVAEMNKILEGLGSNTNKIPSERVILVGILATLLRIFNRVIGNEGV